MVWGEGQPVLLEAKVVGSPWQFSGIWGTEHCLSSALEITPPFQDKRKGPSQLSPEKELLVSGQRNPVRDSGNTRGKMRSLSVLVRTRERSGLNRKKVSDRVGKT